MKGGWEGPLINLTEEVGTGAGKNTSQLEDTATWNLSGSRPPASYCGFT
jgi:hypothetical protein